MSNLRKYINLVEERTDRFGNPYDPTVNPHAAADAARAATPQPTGTPTDQIASMSPAQQARWKTKNPEMARMGPDQYNRYVDKNSPTTTTSASAKSSATRTKKSATPATKTTPTTPKTSKPGTPTTPTAGAKKPAAGTVAGATAGQAAKAKTPAPKPSYSGSQYGYQSPEDVKGIQQMLVNMGYAMPVDGKWGPKTDAAYKAAYQQMYGTAPGTPSQANVPGTPDAWTKAQTAKPGQSADMAAAVGMPNPYIKESIEVSRIKDLIKYNR